MNETREQRLLGLQLLSLRRIKNSLRVLELRMSAPEEEFFLSESKKNVAKIEILTGRKPPVFYDYAKANIADFPAFIDPATWHQNTQEKNRELLIEIWTR